MFFNEFFTAELLVDTIAGLVGFVGIAVFAGWLVNSKFGTKALENPVLRVNFLPFGVVFAVIFGWVAVTVLTSSFVRSVAADLPDWQQDFAIYASLAAIEVIIAILVIASAGRFFDGGLGGLGLRAKKVGADILAAAVLLTVSWPLVAIALQIVAAIGQWLVGPDFQMSRNEGLVVIVENEQMSLRFLTIFFAVVLTPLFEELLFRGLLQSYLRSIGIGPWKTIFAASLIFSLLHPLLHFPALMVLAVFMGYAYEKSGSLYRSIFLHMFFNGSMVLLALSG